MNRPPQDLARLFAAVRAMEISPECVDRTERAIMCQLVDAPLRSSRPGRGVRIGWALALLATGVALWIVRSPDVPFPAPAHEQGSASPYSYVTFEKEGLGVFRMTSDRYAFEERDDERLLSLHEGALEAQVAPQSSARPLVILAPPLRVTVLGTDLTIHMTSEGTHVILTEGAIRVDSSWGTATLISGESIDSSDPRLAAAASLSREPAATDVAPAVSDSPPGATVAGGLAEQRALFERGLARMLAGHEAEAERIFARLIARYPTSVYAPEAAAHRVYLLRELGRQTEFEQAAVEYGRRYPKKHLREPPEHPSTPSTTLEEHHPSTQQGAER